MTLTIHSRHTWLLQIISFMFRTLGEHAEINEMQDIVLRKDIEQAVREIKNGDRSRLIPIESIDDLQKSMGL